MEAGSWGKAIEIFKSANNIDPDCGLVNLLIATSLLAPYRQNQQKKDAAVPVQDTQQFEKVDRYLQFAMLDPGLGEQIKQLRKIAEDIFKPKKI